MNRCPAVIFVALCLSAAAAQDGRGPEVNVSSSPAGVYSEPAAAVSPVNPMRVIVGCNRLGGNGSMPVFVSSDRGRTYARTNLPNTVSGITQHSAGVPSLAFDAAGNAYYGYLMATGTLGEPYRPVVAVLKAGQSQWLGPWPVTSTVSDDDKPWIAVDPRSGVPDAGRIYMAWNRNDPDGAQSILIAGSADGSVWESPVRVDDIATSTEWVIYATPAVGPNGEVYVVWNDYGVDNGGTLRFDRSLNGGRTFGIDVIVTDLRLNLQPELANPYSVYSIPAQPSRGIAACPSLCVDTSSGPRRGRIYLCYGDRAAGKTHDDVDVFLRWSDDLGSTWSAPVQVNDDSTQNSQFFPWMSVDPVDGTVYVCWYDCRDDSANTKAHVYMSCSRNGGVAFETNFRVTTLASDQSSGSGDPNGNDYGDYLALAVHGGQLVVGWTDTRNGYNQTYSRTIITEPYTLADAARALSIAAGLEHTGANDAARLDVAFSSQQDGISLQDAVCICRAVTGLNSIP